MDLSKSHQSFRGWQMSMPFFFGVNYDTLIEPLPSCVTESRPPQFEPVLAGKYVESRIAETYVKVDPKSGEKVQA